MIPDVWLERARERIRPHIIQTPLRHDADRGLFLKCENHQITGSFKLRGALNKVLSLEGWERESGLVAASAGNHGQGVAFAGKLTRSRVEVFVPAHAVPSKVRAIRDLGADVHFVDGGYGETESSAIEYARQHQRTFISPYNDGQVIAGQGTIALEVVEQLAQEYQTPVQDIAGWIVPTGGAGLIVGCGAGLAHMGARSTLIGVQPAASAFTHSLFHRHTQQGVDDNPTLADGLSGAIDESSITIPMLYGLVSDVVTVSEQEIERAISFAWRTYGERIEGSAATALAVAREGIFEARPCVIILTGGNIQSEAFEEIMARHPEQAKQ